MCFEFLSAFIGLVNNISNFYTNMFFIPKFIMTIVYDRIGFCFIKFFNKIVFFF